MKKIASWLSFMTMRGKMLKPISGFFAWKLICFLVMFLMIRFIVGRFWFESSVRSLNWTCCFGFRVVNMPNCSARSSPFAVEAVCS